MPKLIQVDEDQYNKMVQVAQVAQQIYQNPDGRKLLEQAQKTVQPNAPTPAMDAAAALQAPILELTKKFENLSQSIIDDRTKRDETDKLSKVEGMQAAAFARLRQHDKYTDAGIEAVKKLMAEKGILDPIDAACIFERMQPPAQPMTPMGSNGVPLIEKMNDTTDKAIQELLQSKGESAHALGSLINGALDDVRNGRA